ncbi:MAG TPA: response regulator [Polyangia bacterium]|nr:response regulator [Polyangia bacterium]
MSKRVLIVDDDAAIRRLYATILTKHGYDVIERESADDLVALVVAAEPLVLLLDLMMPAVDGLEAAERVRRDWRTQDVRIIMLSAAASFEAARRATEIGVERYLVKPIRSDALVAAVEGRSPERIRSVA